MFHSTNSAPDKDQLFTHEEIRFFCMESNAAFGMNRETPLAHIEATERLIRLKQISVEDMVELGKVFLPATHLRTVPGMDTMVGSFHRPPPGGPDIEKKFNELIQRANDGGHPYEIHQEYLELHPFRDGNGRTGRALWAWGMINQNIKPWLKVGFFRAWYYQSAEFSQRASADRKNRKE